MEPLNKETTEATDVFISYRREDGATAARLLCDVLERRHISVFFDRETLGSGNFDVALQQHLDAARNILVVVSQEMFKRGLTPEGNYDPLIVENDVLYKELRASIKAEKNVIPVFVNGVHGFPANLPECIAKIAKYDALTFNHEHFKAELAKLIGRLVTPKHLLLDAYLEADKDFYDGNLESLLRVCQKLSDTGGEDIESALIKLIRSNWERSTSSDEKALDALLDGGSPKFIKLLCKKLGLDNAGGMLRMKSNLLVWLKQGNAKKYSQSETKADKLFIVRDACAEVYKSHEEKQRIVSQIYDRFGDRIDLSSMRSSWDIFYDVFNDIDVAELFEEMGTFFQEQEIKLICDYMSVNSQGRKGKLIDRIVAFANYEFDNEDETDQD